MPVVLARVDERLVHGQIITTWTKQFQVHEIYIIDDKIADDPFIFQVLTLSAPSGMKFEVLKVEKAIERLKKENNQNILLLFKSVQYALELVEAGYPLPSLNIGNLGSAPNRRSISKNVSMTETEIEMTKKLVEKGCHVYLQMLYSDSKIDFKNTI